MMPFKRYTGLILFLSISSIHSFISHSNPHGTFRRTELLGGYYTEPDTKEITLQQHMVFGIKCAEEKIWLPNGQELVSLYPMSQNRRNPPPYALMEFMMEYHADLLENRRILVIGNDEYDSGLVALLAGAGGASSVVSCHTSEQALNLQVHSQQFFNLDVSFSCSIEGYVWNGEALPFADFIFVTMPTDPSVQQALDQVAGAQIYYAHDDAGVAP